MPDEIATFLRVAEDAADAAARAAMRWFGRAPAAETKADGTPVTVADREAEAAARAVIAAACPGHAILGEEEGGGADARSGGPSHRWILDPIDGTKSFVQGVPLWGALVALERDGDPLVGVCVMPALGERVAAAHGRGCRWNGAPCRVSETRTLADAVLVTTSPRALRRRTPRWTALEDEVRLVRGWSDCWAYVLVATGRADIAVDPVMQPWDCGPFVTILEEAGGRFTDWLGRRTIRGGDAVATNGLLHDAVLARLTSGACT